MIAQLKQSQIYRDYEQAFRETTGLPLSLRSIEAFDLPHQGDPKENPFLCINGHNEPFLCVMFAIAEESRRGGSAGAQDAEVFCGIV